MSNQRFSPGDIESLTGWKADILRDLRNKGFLENYGIKGENSRWTYDKHDLVAFWVAAEIQKRMQAKGAVSLALAFAEARHASAMLVGMMLEGVGGRFKRFRASLVDANGRGQIITFQDLSDLSGYDFRSCEIKDWATYIEAMPDGIRSAVMA
ncbi:hypothetical protein KUV73_20415 [Mameliella alba]|nr:hypothetical protein [Mameliella alba]MBY6171523.1 hypothetical protein [Mameliella alba]MBY6176747.1 hypothetical protein [Mameliella alba]